jgi:hypothetical protein
VDADAHNHRRHKDSHVSVGSPATTRARLEERAGRAIRDCDRADDGRTDGSKNDPDGANMNHIESRFAFRGLDILPDAQPDDDEIVTVGGAMAHVEYVEVTAPRTLFVRFDDGVSGTVHFEESHLFGVFEKLKDTDYFAKVGISYGAVCWPNEDPDLAPDNMHSHLKRDGKWVLN